MIGRVMTSILHLIIVGALIAPGWAPCFQTSWSGHGEENQVCRCANFSQGDCSCCGHPGGNVLGCGLIHAENLLLQPTTPHLAKLQIAQGPTVARDPELPIVPFRPPVSRVAVHVFPEHYGGTDFLFQFCRLIS